MYIKRMKNPYVPKLKPAQEMLVEDFVASCEDILTVFPDRKVDREMSLYCMMFKHPHIIRKLEEYGIEGKSFFTNLYFKYSMLREQSGTIANAGKFTENAFKQGEQWKSNISDSRLDYDLIAKLKTNLNYQNVTLNEALWATFIWGIEDTERRPFKLPNADEVTNNRTNNINDYFFKRSDMFGFLGNSYQGKFKDAVNDPFETKKKKNTKKPAAKNKATNRVTKPSKPVFAEKPSRLAKFKKLAYAFGIASASIYMHADQSIDKTNKIDKKSASVHAPVLKLKPPRI